MSLVPMKLLLDKALEGKFAYGAFNVHTTNEVKAAIEIHETFRSPVILQIIEFATGFIAGREDFLNATLEEKIEGIKIITEKVKEAAKKTDIPVVLHLDHGHDKELVKACIDEGFTSVMIDGSYLPFEENIALTKEIADYAHKKGVTVEGELGVLAGREDNANHSGSLYTDPNKVCEFFEKTGVDCLAISYGTSHGAAKGKDVVISKEIAIASYENMKFKNIKGSLVSHGSSTVPKYLVEGINKLDGKLKNAHGIPIEQVLEVVPYGIAKVNVGTDIRLAITRYIREYFKNNKNIDDNSRVGQIKKIIEDRPELIDERVYLYPMYDSVISGTGKTTEENDILECVEKGVKEIVGQLIVKYGQVGTSELF
ncbi:class II fructose-bisphosphate aldolase [Vallitalea maricola]|uniref:Class II fructose-1,6-bisphosphate aldolase n=1 Tax=Vallitalea maricola TaxID=3074433 RepID=A0ACB5UNR3_9FIRM|nr:class II fructose-1,6-bisphosphate aldolase [Vallitalea sp. AN17-2]